MIANRPMVPAADADVQGAEAHLHQERPRERLRQVVAEACRARRRPGSRARGAGPGSPRRGPTPPRGATAAAAAATPARERASVTSIERQVDERQHQVHERPRHYAASVIESRRRATWRRGKRRVRAPTAAPVLLLPQHLDGVVRRSRCPAWRRRTRSPWPARPTMTRPRRADRRRRRGRGPARAARPGMRKIQPRLRPRNGQRIAVHQRRPEELEGPGRLRERDQARRP